MQIHAYSQACAIHAVDKQTTVQRADGSTVGPWTVKIWCDHAGDQTYNGGDSDSCHGRVNPNPSGDEWFTGDVLFFDM